jgi:hypothetical protein
MYLHIGYGNGRNLEQVVVSVKHAVDRSMILLDKIR